MKAKTLIHAFKKMPSFIQRPVPFALQDCLLPSFNLEDKTSTPRNARQLTNKHCYHLSLSWATCVCSIAVLHFSLKRNPSCRRGCKSQFTGSMLQKRVFQGLQNLNLKASFFFLMEDSATAEKGKLN